MHPDGLAALQVAMRLDRFGGVHVGGGHEPARFIGADRQQGDVGRAQAMADVAPMLASGRVPGK
ncbi:hypothetical protein GALL_529320 [mine drainage metagenome]|uniref:Uncharacterized protein n=1 Tax=mine drainage metagenome TaxID=410659 RepID=A0A1J5P354_9ZZZZ